MLSTILKNLNPLADYIHAHTILKKFTLCVDEGGSSEFHESIQNIISGLRKCVNLKELRIDSVPDDGKILSDALSGKYNPHNIMCLL